MVIKIPIGCPSLTYEPILVILPVLLLPLKTGYDLADVSHLTRSDRSLYVDPFTHVYALEE